MLSSVNKITSDKKKKKKKKKKRFPKKKIEKKKKKKTKIKNKIKRIIWCGVPSDLFQGRRNSTEAGVGQRPQDLEQWSR